MTETEFISEIESLGFIKMAASMYSQSRNFIQYEHIEKRAKTFIRITPNEDIEMWGRYGGGMFTSFDNTMSYLKEAFILLKNLVKIGVNKWEYQNDAIFDAEKYPYFAKMYPYFTSINKICVTPVK